MMKFLRNLDERLKYLRNLEDRKEQVISAISDQGKMTAELEKQIREAATLVAVEDLYRPYKLKRRTRAMIAREKGPGVFGKCDPFTEFKGICGKSGRGLCFW